MIGRRGLVRMVLGGIALIALGGCGRVNEFRYKMIVEVETPDGIKSGYAVRQVRYSEPGNYPSIGESKPQWSVKGEAVAVDLPRGKVLFALLTSGDSVVDYAGRDIDFLFRELGGKKIQLWPNPPKSNSPRINDTLPMLVTFDHLSDPTSVQRIDPGNLVASFGSGFRLKSIHVQVTDEPVTVGIGKRLDKNFWAIWENSSARIDASRWGNGKSLFQNFARHVEPEQFYDGERDMTISRNLMLAILSMDS